MQNQKKGHRNSESRQQAQKASGDASEGAGLSSTLKSGLQGQMVHPSTHSTHFYLGLTGCQEMLPVGLHTGRDPDAGDTNSNQL